MSKSAAIGPGDLIILRAGSGSKLQTIAPKASFYVNGKWESIDWISVWPKSSDGTIVGKGYYILRKSDVLYAQKGAFSAYMRMNLPGCDNATCNVDGYLLQDYGISE